MDRKTLLAAAVALALAAVATRRRPPARPPREVGTWHPAGSDTARAR